MQGRLLATILMLPFVGCKAAETESTALSLDNLASQNGAAVTNSCSGSYQLSALDSDSAARFARQVRYPAAVKADVEAALSAVPTTLKKTFLSFGYEIEFRDDAAAVCAAAQGGNGGVGCALPEKLAQEGEDAEKIKVVVSSKPQDIRHGALLALLSVVDRKLPHVRFEDGQPKLVDEKDEGSVKFRRALAVYVLHDEYKAGRAGFARYASLIPADASFKAKETTVEQRGAIWEAHEKAAPEKAAKFMDLVSENAADSFYCSDASRASMRRDYPEAYALYEADMAPVIAGLGASLRGQAEGGEGLSLWGRWGFGNGPLRQLGANRMENTGGYLFPRMHGMRRSWNGDGWVYPTSGLGWRLRGDYE